MVQGLYLKRVVNGMLGMNFDNVRYQLVYSNTTEMPEFLQRLWFVLPDEPQPAHERTPAGHA